MSKKEGTQSGQVKKRTTLYYSVVVSRTGTGISTASTPQRRSHHDIERDDSRQSSFWMWGGMMDDMRGVASLQ